MADLVKLGCQDRSRRECNCEPHVAAWTHRCSSIGSMSRCRLVNAELTPQKRSAVSARLLTTAEPMHSMFKSPMEYGAAPSMSALCETPRRSGLACRA